MMLDRMPTYEPSNAPLTLDELREMNGEPVWVKFKPEFQLTINNIYQEQEWMLVCICGEMVFLVNNYWKCNYLSENSSCIEAVFRHKPD